MEKMTVKLTFVEGILGTCPNDENIYRNYITTKATAGGAVMNEEIADEEVEALPLDEQIEKGMTVFPRTSDGIPFLYDYQIKGFFKNSCGILKKISGTESSKVKAYKKEIDGLIFPSPRKIVFENAELGICQRPLRAQTMKGERVALSMSEEISAGATVTFDILYYDKNQEKLICEWLDYGALNGIGQWHNSGKGRFTWEEIK